MLNCVVSEEHKCNTSTAEAALNTLGYIWLLTKILLKLELNPSTSTGSIMQMEPFPCIWKRTNYRNIKHEGQTLYLLIMIDSILTCFLQTGSQPEWEKSQRHYLKPYVNPKPPMASLIFCHYSSSTWEINASFCCNQLHYNDDWWWHPIATKSQHWYIQELAGSDSFPSIS